MAGLNWLLQNVLGAGGDNEQDDDDDSDESADVDSPDEEASSSGSCDTAVTLSCDESTLLPGAFNRFGKGDQRWPMARSGHRMCSDASGGFIYALGGYNPNAPHINADLGEDNGDDDEETCLRELWRMNTATGAWQRVLTTGTFPPQMASFAMCTALCGRALLVIGGTAVPFGETATNDAHLLWLHGEHAGSWTKLAASGQLPERAYGQALAPLSPTGFVLVGGTDGHHYSIRVHRLEIRLDHGAPDTWLACWEQLFDDTGGALDAHTRYRHEVVVRHDKLVVFGGGTRHTCFGFDKLDVFDMATREWSWSALLTEPDATCGYPAPRKCHVLLEWGDTVLVVGGVSGPQYDEVLAHFDPAAARRDIRLQSDVWSLTVPPVLSADGAESGGLRWRKLHATLPQPIYFHAGCITPDGCAYTFGGVVDRAAHERTACMQRAWLLAPPTLTSLALDALLRHRPKLADEPVESLWRYGIPRHIARRVNGDAPPPVHTVRAA